MRKFGTREWVAVGAALVVTVALFFGNNVWRALTGAKDSAENPQTLATNSAASRLATTTVQMQNISNVPGLEAYDVKVGTGAEAVAGKTITAHYVGVLTNGQKFDSSIDRGEPFSFKLGAGQVIKGWDIGIQGMKIGGVRRLVISPELGYGAQGIGPIPPNSTLVFEVQLLDVK